jgi:hypothetical protein
VRELLTQKLHESLDALNRAASGDSLCTLSGDRVEAVKYLEGQVIAIKNVLKRLEQGPSLEPGDVVDDATRDWNDRNPEGFSDAPSWVSYRLGGLDAFATIMALINGR